MLASAQTPKFGTINTEEVFAVMPETKAAQDEITAATKQYEDEYAKLNEEMQKKFTDYQALQNDASTPQSIKDRRLQEMQDLDRSHSSLQQPPSRISSASSSNSCSLFRKNSSKPFRK